MQDLLRRHLDNGLAAFEGLSLSGTIPVTEAALNEILSEALASASGAAPADASPRSSTESPAELAKLLRLVRKLHVAAEAGRVVVTFEIRV